MYLVKLSFQVPPMPSKDEINALLEKRIGRRDELLDIYLEIQCPVCKSKRIEEVSGPGGSFKKAWTWGMTGQKGLQHNVDYLTRYLLGDDEANYRCTTCGSRSTLNDEGIVKIGNEIVSCVKEMPNKGAPWAKSAYDYFMALHKARHPEFQLGRQYPDYEWLKGVCRCDLCLEKLQKKAS